MPDNPKTPPVAESVMELAAMLDATTQEKGCTIFDHTPEEIGLHVMENYRDIRSILPRPIKDDTPTDAGEGVEPVAVIGMNWQLLWADQQTLTGIVNRTGIKIGSLLYAHPTPTDTGLVGELVEARAEIDRLRGLLIDPGDQAWEDARAVLVAELRKLVLDRAADAVAESQPAMIPSWLALNLIAHAIKAKATR